MIILYPISVLLQCSSFLTVSGDQPTLPELTSFQSRGRTVNIAVEISTKSYQFCIQLLDDGNGARFQATEYKYERDVVKMNTHILVEWLQGRGVQPVSWTTLAKVLEDIDLGTLASDIERLKDCLLSPTRWSSNRQLHSYPVWSYIEYYTVSVFAHLMNTTQFLCLQIS